MTGELLESVAKAFDLDPQESSEHFQSKPPTNVCVIDYNDGTVAAGDHQ